MCVPNTEKVELDKTEDEVVQDLKNRLARLELSDVDTEEALSTLYSRVIDIEKHLSIGKFAKK